MKVTFVLVHNKTDQGNIDQIDTLKSMLNTVTHTQYSRDENDNIVAVFDVSYYEFTGLGITHQVKIYQVVPFGIAIPANISDLESQKVFYGNGDEDKTGDHPRFFNWGLKRGTDDTAEAIIYVIDVDELTVESIETQLNALATDLLSSTGQSVIVAGLVYTDFGLLDESMTFADTITDLQERIDNG